MRNTILPFSQYTQLPFSAMPILDNRALELDPEQEAGASEPFIFNGAGATALGKIQIVVWMIAPGSMYSIRYYYMWSLSTFTKLYSN